LFGPGETGRRYVPGWLRIATVGLCLPSLAACQGSVQDALGMGKRSPDEFAVVSRAPLIVPPDFELRPPGRGEAPRPSGTTADRARATLTGDAPDVPSGVQPASEPALTSAEPAMPVQESAGEAALLRQTGAAGSDPHIRERLAEEGGAPGEVEPAMFERLMRRPSGGPNGGADGASPTIVQREQTEIDQLVEREN
jgi:hypothetical protein